jgi:hypothetical protein
MSIEWWLYKNHNKLFWLKWKIQNGIHSWLTQRLIWKIIRRMNRPSYEKLESMPMEEYTKWVKTR